VNTQQHRLSRKNAFDLVAIIKEENINLSLYTAPELQKVLMEKSGLTFTTTTLRDVVRDAGLDWNVKGATDRKRKSAVLSKRIDDLERLVVALDKRVSELEEVVTSMGMGSGRRVS